MKNVTPEQPPQMPNMKVPFMPLIIALGVIFIIFFVAPWVIVSPGNVGVVELLGTIEKEELQPGFHLKNPIAKVHEYPTRDNVLNIEKIGVPSQDQLITEVDLTILWKVDPTLASEAYIESGDVQALQAKQLIPSVRTLLREAGKSVQKAEFFFLPEVQASMQSKILAGLDNLKEKGVIVMKVQLRDFEMPIQVSQGVIRKKEQEQAAERQKAEFERFKTEQQQKVATAEAEKEAAIQEAEQRKALADAKAYEITAEAKARAEAIRIEAEALGQSPELLKLRAIEKWSGTLPKVIMGEGATTPLLNLEDLSK